MEKIKAFLVEDDFERIESLFYWDDNGLDLTLGRDYIAANKLINQKASYDIFIIDLMLRFSSKPINMLEEPFKELFYMQQKYFNTIPKTEQSIFWGKKIIEDIFSIKTYDEIPLIVLSAVPTSVIKELLNGFRISRIILKRSLRNLEFKKIITDTLNIE